MKNKILVIDIETTGFLQRGGKIVEIGIVELDLNNGKIVEIFNNVCHENGVTLQEVKKSWIVNNSDLTVDDIRNSKNLEYYREKLQAIFDKYICGITAYNNKFDFGFLENRGFIFKNKLPCPMLLSTNICKLKNKKGGYKWPKVQEAYDFYFGKNDYIEKHRGLDDAKHEAGIVYEMYKRGIFKI